MDPAGKRAYRLLLYHAMLDLRAGGPSFVPADASTLTTSQLNEVLEDSRHGKIVAHWLHNLADASADEFAEFDEKAFWEQFNLLRDQSPSPARFDTYRTVFDRASKNS